ncbi:hypothetical protein LTR05_000908 [Lithohypha guttulata]|uniref:Aryl sulfotransferase n=1 Tax=Lithohypha guttulata TaxID=1690604 RepID=A0AAN7Y9W8_9EURO|nr:hypothetical protein LTR05_000908 [Lithohypha guttulata]
MEQNRIKRQGVGITGVDKARTNGGYTLICSLTSTTIRLIDIDGQEVHLWEVPSALNRHAYLLPNGNLVVNTVDPNWKPASPCFSKHHALLMSELSPSGEVLRQYRDEFGHHDAYYYPNGSGRILYISLEALTLEESKSIIGGVPGSEKDGVILSDTIKEIDAQGSLLWSWHAKDKFARDIFPLQSRYRREHYPLINSICPLHDGNVLVSCRSVSHVVIISRATGNIIWKLGPDVLAGQHDASELPSGNILVFDNGFFRDGQSIPYSRAIEVERTTKQIVWEYKDCNQRINFFTPIMGSAQRLRNGNTLLCESVYGRVFEVMSDGTVVWEYVNEHFAEPSDPVKRKLYPGESNELYRAYRYDEDQIPWLKEKLRTSRKGAVSTEPVSKGINEIR